MYSPAHRQGPFVRTFLVRIRPYTCWEGLFDIYKNDYGFSGNRNSCENHLLTFYMLYGLTCSGDSPLHEWVGGGREGSQRQNGCDQEDRTYSATPRRTAMQQAIRANGAMRGAAMSQPAQGRIHVGPSVSVMYSIQEPQN